MRSGRRGEPAVGGYTARMTDDKLDRDTPASPRPDAATRHGDALLDGSRHGTPPQESVLADEEKSEDEKA